MKLLRNLFTILLIVAMVAVGVLFALQNDAQVPLDMLVYTFQPRSLALWVLLALALGGVLGILMSGAILLRTRATLNATRRQLTQARVEIDKLRTAGLVTGE